MSRTDSASRPGVPRGVTAAELIARGGLGDRLDAREFERWLVDGGLAVPNGAPGLLIPTRLAFELVEALAM
jgi:hypothetical protein